MKKIIRKIAAITLAAVVAAGLLAGDAFAAADARSRISWLLFAPGYLTETVVASSKEISTDAPFTLALPVFRGAAEAVKTAMSNRTEKTIAYFVVFPFISCSLFFQ